VSLKQGYRFTSPDYQCAYWVCRDVLMVYNIAISWHELLR